MSGPQPGRVDDVSHHQWAEDALLVHSRLAGRVLQLENIEPLRAVCPPVVVAPFGHGRSPTPTARPTGYRPTGCVGELEASRVTTNDDPQR